MLFNICYVMLCYITCVMLYVWNSAFRIPDPTHSTNPTKTWPTVNKLTFTAFSLFSLLRLVKTTATWKTVIESMQS